MHVRSLIRRDLKQLSDKLTGKQYDKLISSVSKDFCVGLVAEEDTKIHGYCCYAFRPNSLRVFAIRGSNNAIRAIIGKLVVKTKKDNKALQVATSEFNPTLQQLLGELDFICVTEGPKMLFVLK